MTPYGKMGGREEPKLSAAKRSYKSAKAEGNHQEEAKWANVIGHILKDRGEYVEALRWLRLDYEISFKFLTQRHCFATCQSLGEVYLLLKDFKEALSYQKKHLELAKDANDLAEQQRANTQLGRTYYEMLLSFKDDNNLVMSAKKYFNTAMELAQALKDNPPANNCSFLEEYIDAHNNIGMLEMELDNFEEAQKILSKGLEICDEEEVMGDDAGRSRLHHNLGFVYMELRMWVKAKYHMEKDILICKRIGHCQGEAKGYINLGVLHYRNQRYDEALDCYKRAHNLAKSMEDEDSLVGEIDQNIESAKEAKKIMGELTKEEQNLKKLKRYMNSAKGTSRERNCLLQQNASLDCLIDKARLISLWLKLLEFGKRKKGIASELCDKEKLSDSFMFIGEAYENLRKFSKASKWYTKSWETYKSIGNLEGQAMAQLNIGNVLDSDGNWQEALDAYEECYRIATEAKLDSIQLTALENMNYSHLIRFNNVDKARKYQLLINKLKESKDTELGKQDVMTENYCSESDTEGNIHTSNDRSNACDSPETLANVQEMSDDVPLISLLQSTRGSPKIKPTNMEKQKTSSNFKNFSPKGSSRSISNQDTVGRKRVRVVLSDDEDETFVEVERSKGRTLSYPVEDVATSDGFKSQSNTVSPVCVIQDVSVASKCTIRSCTPVNIEESSSSYKNTGPFVATQNGEGHKSSSAKKNDQCITIKIDKELIHVEAVTFVTTDKLSIESVKVELACLYYLQLPGEKRSEGLFPIIQHIRCGDRVIESLETIETLKDQMGKVLVEAFIDGWVQKRLIKLYIDSCKEISETPNMKLLKKLYDLEVSDDEITVSDCELQDISVTPLLNALHAHKTFAVLDLSHNLLGNVTMEKLQRVFTDSGQKYGGLMLDLHCNRFGPTALFQICECPSLFARLEVLNIAGNRLTDACASYLSTILQNCRALCSLNIEGCSVTSRTFQKVADALDSGSALEQLFVGHNNPLSGNAIVNLLVKLTALKRFSKLSLNGLKLSKPVIDSLGLLAKTSSLSALMLGETGIGTEGALAVTELLFKGSEDSVKLDLSYCGLTSEYILKLNADASIVCCILELNLAGNPIAQQGTTALSSLLLNPQCCLKVLALEKCQLGVAGILQILQALADNNSLEDLNLADNADADQGHALQHDITSKGCTEILQPQTNIPESSPKMCAPKEVEPAQQGLCPENADLNQLQVADSEDEHIKVGAVASGTDDSCTSSCQRNSSPECQLIQELSTAISKAKKLQLLDLSNNGFSTQAAELFAAWSSSRPCPAYRHIKDQIIHLFTEGKKCCIKPCCKKD